MSFHSSSIVEKVRELRKKGATLRQLEAQFSIANTTISTWVRDIEVNNATQRYIKSNIELWKKVYQNEIIDLNVDSKNAKLLLSLLYWCEGSKYPSSNSLTFSNSDCRMVKTYLELLRKGFLIDELKIKVHLQVHTTHNYEDIRKFWSKLLQIPENQFYKPTITHPTDRMKRKKYLGTCTLKYFDVKLQAQIMGIYEHFSQKFTGGLAEW